MENWKAKFPEWTDEDMMKVRLGRLEARPHLLEWWVNVLVVSSDALSMPAFTFETLQQRFTQSSRYPLSLDLIIEEAKKQRKVMTKEDFLRSCESQTWTEWTLSVVTSPLGYLLGKKTSIDAQEFVAIPVIQRLANEVFQRVQSRAVDTTDRLILMADLAKEFSHLELIVPLLEKDKRVAKFTWKDSVVLKFGDGRSPAKVDSVDTSIISLKSVDVILQAQVAKLEAQVAKLDEESRKQVRISAVSARQTLRRKKAVEHCLQSRRDAHENIIRTLLSIQMSQVNSEVLSAVKESTSALQQEQKKVSVDDVENLLDDVREIISDVNSVSEAVSKVEGDSNAEEDEALMKELEMLQLEDELDKLSTNTKVASESGISNPIKVSNTSTTTTTKAMTTSSTTTTKTASNPAPVQFVNNSPQATQRVLVGE